MGVYRGISSDCLFFDVSIDIVFAHRTRVRKRSLMDIFIQVARGVIIFMPGTNHSCHLTGIGSL